MILQGWYLSRDAHHSLPNHPERLRYETIDIHSHCLTYRGHQILLEVPSQDCNDSRVRSRWTRAKPSTRFASQKSRYDLVNKLLCLKTTTTPLILGKMTTGVPRIFWRPWQLHLKVAFQLYQWRVRVCSPSSDPVRGESSWYSQQSKMVIKLWLYSYSFLCRLKSLNLEGENHASAL